jgi:flagellar basal-body rod protein FlgC
MIRRFILILSFLLFFSCSYQKNIRVLDVTLSESFKYYLDIATVEYEYSNNIFSIRNSKQNFIALVNALEFLALKKAIIKDNIANSNTTRIETGNCYLRKRLVFDPEGNANIEIDNISQTRLVYDPTHPDAINEGARKGYVEYPNVNIDAEIIDLINVNQNIEIVIEIIQIMDPSIIILYDDSEEMREVLKGLGSF